MFDSLKQLLLINCDSYLISLFRFILPPCLYIWLWQLWVPHIQTMGAQMFTRASVHTHTHTHKPVLPHVCERVNAVYHTGSSLSGGAFTCCNRVYMSRLQEMRGWDVQVWTFPNRMSCSATPGYLWQPPHHGIWGLSSASVPRCHGESEGCL